MRVRLGAALALAVLAASGWRIHVHVQGGRKHARHRHRIEDQNSLRQVVGLLVSRKELPMKDGVLDPYDLVRRGEIGPANYRVFRSERLGGPTDAEIEAFDYARFPWERLRGERPVRSGPPVPLLWDRRPDEDGRVLVAWSDGSAQALDRETLARALAEAGHGR